MYCPECHSLYSGAESCPHCHPTAEKKKAAPIVAPQSSPKTSGYTAAPATQPAEASVTSKATAAISNIGAALQDKRTAIKTTIIADVIKCAVLAFMAFLMLFTPVFGDSFAEFFFDSFEYMFEYFEDFILCACFVWGVTIMVRLVIRAIKGIKKLRNFNAFYENALYLSGDELYSEVTDGKSGKKDLRLTLEFIICVLISLIMFSEFYYLDGAMIFIPMFFILIIVLPVFLIKKSIRSNIVN